MNKKCQSPYGVRQAIAVDLDQMYEKYVSVPLRGETGYSTWSSKQSQIRSVSPLTG